MAARRAWRGRRADGPRLRGLGQTLIAASIAAGLCALAAAQGVAADFERVAKEALASPPAERAAARQSLAASARAWLDAVRSADESERARLLAASERIERKALDPHADAETAIDVFDALLEAQRASGAVDAARESDLAYQIAKLDLRFLRPAHARAALDGTIERVRAAEPPLYGWLLALRGSFDRMEGRPIDAIESFRAAKRAAARTEPDVSWYVAAEIAGVFLEIGLTDLALTWLDEQEAAAAPATPEERHAVSLQHVRCLLAAGRSASAMRAADDALDALDAARAEFAGWRAIRAQYRALRGNAAMERFASDPLRLVEAQADLEEAIEEPTLSRLERADALLRLAALAIARDDFAAADAHLAAARADLGASGTSTLVGVRAKALEARVAREGAGRGAARPYARERDELELAFDSFLEKWASTPVHAAGVGFLQYPMRRHALGELVAIDVELDGPRAGVERAFASFLRAQAMSTLARRLHATAGSLEELRADVLEPGDVVLAYLPAPFASHLFVVDCDSIERFELASADLLQTAQASLAAAIGARPSASGAIAEARAAARAFRDLALPEVVRARLRSALTITVTGLDLAGWAAFEVVEIEGLGELGAAKPIAHVPSLPLALALARRARAPRDARGTLALVAPALATLDRAAHPELADLPWRDVDGRALAKELGANGVVLAGEHASLDEARARRPSALLVLAHGVSDPALDRPAGLALASSSAGASGCAYSDDVEALFEGRAPPVVALFACGAARAPLRRGDEGVNHLGGAFLAAGSDTVALSTADLDVEATRVMLAIVARELARGAALAEALRAARAEMARDMRFEHPYYRSLVAAVGLAHRT